jgi:transposase
MTLCAPKTSADLPELPDRVETLQEMVRHLLEDLDGRIREIQDLRQQLEWFKRHVFGRRSEKMDPNQLALFADLARRLEEAEAACSPADTGKAQEGSPASEALPAPTTKRKGHGRRPFPADLPRERIEIPVAEPDRICPCCQEPMTPFGEEITEKVDYEPASFVVRQYVRPKYACRRCQEGVVIAPLPPQPVAKGSAAPGLLAQVLTSKYADHLPLYRQQGIFRRHGVEISDSTMMDWVRDMADLLSPIVEELKEQLGTCHHVNTDDTPVTVLDLAGRPSGRGYLYVYIGDEAQVVFDFTESRRRDGPLMMLGGYGVRSRGCVQGTTFSLRWVGRIAFGACGGGLLGMRVGSSTTRGWTTRRVARRCWR